ncbi:MAG: hypothetical protein U0T33_10140 [Bacteroidales bacterium]
MNFKKCEMAYNEKQKRILNRLGYYDYQNGLIHRRLNQGKGWDRHLENCRNFIMRAINSIQPVNITVLGSGWLLDLPLKELSERTGIINLVDIVHPPDAIKQLANLGNIRFIEADVTGGLIWEVWEKTSGIPFMKKKIKPEDLNIPAYKLPDDPGLVISLNLLSQLETLPLRRLKEKTDASDSEIMAFRHKIQKSHLDLLMRNKSILITDVCEIYSDKKGNKSEIETVVIDLPFGQMREEWTWDFDLVRSDYYEMNSVLKVVALAL